MMNITNILTMTEMSDFRRMMEVLCCPAGRCTKSNVRWSIMEMSISSLDKGRSTISLWTMVDRECPERWWTFVNVLVDDWNSSMNNTWSPLEIRYNPCHGFWRPKLPSKLFCNVYCHGIILFTFTRARRMESRLIPVGRGVEILATQPRDCVDGQTGPSAEQ